MKQQAHFEYDEGEVFLRKDDRTLVLASAHERCDVLSRFDCRKGLSNQAPIPDDPLE